MKDTVVYNSDLHFEHKQWEKELLFWEDELLSFQNRLNELVNRWTDSKVLGELDQYQNQFHIHNNIIDELKEEIEAHESNIAKHYKANEIVIDREHYANHVRFREKMETQRHIYNELKKKFFQFLSKYM
ncbi:hypothetical protein GGR42_000871 [Saonia flava]|uniref:Uncharacterized protein n=1 Tax=Saonia flava TaxID=523696 RepID=A0A846R0L0_9FLAO|nr:hypothetical protein [Saonia flava]NJB70409.1 hypothetical protein [Saonia flava]